MNDETPELKNSPRTKSLCKKNCGYYGSIEFKDMCSKCYRETTANNGPTNNLEDLPASKLKDSKYVLSRAMKRKISETFDILPCSDVNPFINSNSQTSCSVLTGSTPNADVSIKSPAQCINHNNNNNSPNDDRPDGKNANNSTSNRPNKTPDPIAATILNPTSSDPVPCQINSRTLDTSIDPSTSDTTTTKPLDKSVSSPLQEGEASSPTKSENSPKLKASLSNRCHICRKKVGLTGFMCHCEKLCCSLHRYSDQHDCQFDYRKTERAKLAQDNPVIQAAKIRKI